MNPTKTMEVGEKSSKEIGTNIGTAIDGAVTGMALDFSVGGNARRTLRAIFRSAAKLTLKLGLSPQHYLSEAVQAIALEVEKQGGKHSQVIAGDDEGAKVIAFSELMNKGNTGQA